MRKLTLNAPTEVIVTAKRLAAERGTSVSSMFTEFIRSHPHPKKISPSRRTKGNSITQMPLGPLTRKAVGLIKLRTADRKKTYRQLLEDALIEKYV